MSGNSSEAKPLDGNRNFMVWHRVCGLEYATFDHMDPRSSSDWALLRQCVVGDPIAIIPEERGLSFDEMVARHPCPTQGARADG